MIQALLAASVKGALLIVLVALVIRSVPRTSASTRHALWSAALLGVVVLPLLSFLLPPLPLPSFATSPGALEAAWRSGTARDASVVGWTEGLSGWAVLALLWAAGVAVLGLRLALGVVQVGRLRRGSSMVTEGGSLGLAHRLAGTMGLTYGVTLLRSDRHAVPMTWGVLRPVIWLPEEAATWSESRLAPVLAHELAHVRRRDATTRMLGELARVLHWPNPLVWYAVRRQREECERACDDVVLSLGFAPPEYAERLLEVARAATLRSPALAMAGGGSLQRRLTAILDPGLPRRPLRGSARLAALLTGASVLLLLGSLGGGSSGAPETRYETWRTAAPRERTLAAIEDTLSLMALAAPSGGEEPQALVRSAGLLSRERPGVFRWLTRAAPEIPPGTDGVSVLRDMLRDPGLPEPLLREIIDLAAELPSEGARVSLLDAALPHLATADTARQPFRRAVESVSGREDRDRLQLSLNRLRRAETRNE